MKDLAQLKEDIAVMGTSSRMSLTAVDPLYGNVFVMQAGRFILGAVRVKDPSAAKQLVEQLRRGVGDRN